jgi:hypothetical protein
MNNTLAKTPMMIGHVDMTITLLMYIKIHSIFYKLPLLLFKQFCSLTNRCIFLTFK